MSRRNKNQTITETFVNLAPSVWAMEGNSKLMNFYKKPSVAEYGGNNGCELKIPLEDDYVKIWRWGTNNLLPNDREAVITDNHLVHELVATKMAVTEGSSRYFFRKVFEDGTQKQVEVAAPQWWRDLEETTKQQTRVDFDDLFDIALKNLFFHANAPTEFTRTKGGKILSIEAWECKNMRAGKQNTRGFVEDYYWCGNWAKFRKKREEFPVLHCPAYNYNESQKQPKFLVHIMDNLLHDGYYGIPGWWGGRYWIDASNKIPVFHNSNIDNGYFLKLHVEMPKDYFLDARAMSQAKNETELKEFANRESLARKKFMEKVNQLFTGADGNKVLFTEYELNKQIAKDYPGIKIKTVETSKLDESMLKLFDACDRAVISAQGVHPSLASIQTQGKLSSGSELRNALNVYTAIKAPRYRRMLVKIYDIAKAINGSKEEQDIYMGWKNIEVTNLDENPAGMQETLGE